jgi:enamine deaminase RidA (YjgF/YER057c/UK114 family)
MEIARIRPSSLFDGVPYDYGSVAPAGRTLFTAGACPLDADGRTVSPGDLEAQTECALSNLFATLDSAGASPAQVLKTTLFVVAGERQDLARAWNVVQARFGPVHPPSTLLGVSFLGYPDQLVEIEAVAAL